MAYILIVRNGFILHGAFVGFVPVYIFMVTMRSLTTELKQVYREFDEASSALFLLYSLANFGESDSVLFLLKFCIISSSDSNLNVLVIVMY